MNDARIVVRPLRFTDDVEAMGAFLEALGLRTRIQSEGGRWADLVAGAGMVALHDAKSSDTGGQPGQTRLSFEAANLDPLAKALHDAGFADATTWDESYGRVLSVTDPLGDQVWVDEYNDDSYGFKASDPPRDSRLSVLPVRFADPVGPVGPFLEAMGLPPRAEGSNEHWRVWGGHAGLVALHTPAADDGILDGPAAVRLSFETGEPLEEVAQRLDAAGYADADVRPESFRAALYVSDPDGQQVVVHHRRGRRVAPAQP
jgi:hypothetical protein